MIVYPELDTYFYEVKKQEIDSKGNPVKPPIISFGQDLINSFSLSGAFNQYSVQSLSIDEEEFGTLTANITVVDSLNMNALAFRNGQKWTLKWGVYKDLEYLRKILYTTDKNEIGNDPQTEFVRGGSNGLQCFVTNASHTINNNTLVWNVSLRGGYPNGKGKNTVVYNNNETLQQIVTNACTDLLGNSFNPTRDLYFLVNPAKERGRPLVATKRNPVIQNLQTPLEFLRALAIQFNCKFTMFYQGFTQKVLFVGWEDENKINIADKRGLKGTYHYFDSGNRLSNIIDGSGTQNQGSSGSIAFPAVDDKGKPILSFSPQGVETTSEWILNEATVKNKLRTVGNDKQQTDLLNAILSLNYEDFKDETTNAFKSITVNGKKYNLKDFFELKPFQTAPEGGGQEYNLTVIPNPLYQIGDQCWLGAKDKDTLSIIPITFSTSLNPKTNKYSLYRITKISWEHSSEGVTQKLTLKR